MNYSSVDEIINDKPYFICRRAACEREELRSVIGSEIISRYGRSHDEINDFFLKTAITKFIKDNYVPRVRVSKDKGE